MIRFLLVLLIVCVPASALAADDSTGVGDPSQILALLTDHKWVALTAVGIGLIVRLLKSDTKIPIDIPSQYRVWLALALGGAAGALEKLAGVGGATWKEALTQGILGAVVAIVGHNVIIDSMRGGKEVVVPGLIKPGVSPGPGKPPSIKPPPQGGADTVVPPAPRPPAGLSRHTLFLTGIVLAFWMAACNLFSAANAPSTILTLEDLGCIAENAFLNQPELNTVCKFIDPKVQAEGAKVQRAQRLGLAKHAKALATCAPDGGLDASTSDAAKNGAQ